MDFPPIESADSPTADGAIKFAFTAAVKPSRRDHVGRASDLGPRPAAGAHRRRRPDQGLPRQDPRGRPAQLHRRTRLGHRLPRPQRRGQDDHAAHGARSGPPDRRARDDRRPAVPPPRTTRRASSARRSSRRASTRPARRATTCASCAPSPACPISAADEVLELVGLRDAARRKVRGYSMGMRQRLGLAAALLGDPRGARARRAGQRPRPGRHPLAARAASARSPARAAPCWSRATSSTRCEEVADRVVILNHGRLVRQGSIAELTAGTDRVRRPHTDRRVLLAAALRRAAAPCARSRRRTRCGCSGLTPTQVGHLAFARRRRVARADRAALRPRGAVLRADRGTRQPNDPPGPRRVPQAAHDAGLVLDAGGRRRGQRALVVIGTLPRTT